jgi:hypothetical protein
MKLAYEILLIHMWPEFNDVGGNHILRWVGSARTGPTSNMHIKRYSQQTLDR